MKLQVLRAALITVGIFLVGGCQPQSYKGEVRGVRGISLKKEEVQPFSYAQPFDPLEPLNRCIFGINEVIDYLIIEPFLTIYKEATPLVFQDRVDDFFTNMEMPLNAVNFMLQGDGKGVLESIARFCVNFIFGFFGVVDVVKLAGDPPRTTGYGQTFAKWGATPGPYLILPIIGPTTLRGALGLGAEFYGDPASIMILQRKRVAHRQAYSNALTIGVGANERVRVMDDILAVKKGALDPYSSLRSSYWQFMLRRTGELKESLEEEGPRPDTE